MYQKIYRRKIQRIYSIVFIVNLLSIKLLIVGFYFLIKCLIINNPIVKIKIKIVLVLKRKESLLSKI